MEARAGWRSLKLTSEPRIARVIVLACTQPHAPGRAGSRNWSIYLHRYAQDREARFRDGVRVLLGAVVVPVTWFYTTMGLIVGGAPWLADGPEPIRNLVLRGISVLFVATAVALIVGLVRASRWRWGMAGAWVGALVAIAVLMIVPPAGWHGTIAPGLAGVVLAAAYAWAFVEFDPPPA